MILSLRVSVFIVTAEPERLSQVPCTSDTAQDDPDPLRGQSEGAEHPISLPLAHMSSLLMAILSHMNSTEQSQRAINQSPHTV